MIEAKGLLYAGVFSLLLSGCEAAPGTGPTPVIPAVLGSQIGSVNRGVELDFGNGERVRVSRINNEAFLITAKYPFTGHSAIGLGMGLEYLRANGCQVWAVKSDSPGVLVAEVNRNTPCAAEIS